MVCTLARLSFTEAGSTPLVSAPPGSLGRDDLCLQNLKGLEEDAAKTDDQIPEEYQPSDADNYLPVVKATRTNLILCRSGKKTTP
jgi:hypothetical protein